MKSIALLIGVLCVGIGLGALGTSTLQHRRMAALREARQQGGLMRALERVVEIEDEGQRASIEVILHSAETDFRAVRRTCSDSLAVYREALMADLREVFTPEQRETLDQWLQRDRERRSNGRGRSGNRRPSSRERP